MAEALVWILIAAQARIAELEAQLSARQAAPEGWRLVPAEATRSMMAAAVIYANGNAVYKNVAAPVLEIEESIYGEAYTAMLSAAPPPPEREPQCWCETCDTAANSGLRTRMSLCPASGNKRCPRSNHHDNACTNSNAPGQKGSSWEHVKGASNE